jgi:putative sterol carrier protein
MTSDERKTSNERKPSDETKNKEKTNLKDDSLEEGIDEVSDEEESVLTPQDPDIELDELRASVQDDSDDSEDVEQIDKSANLERTPSTQSSNRGRRIDSAEGLLGEEIVHRANREQTKLRPYLTGKIQIDIIDKKQKYLFDWSSDVVSCQKNENGNTSDCSITLTEDNLLRIASGDLNPQLAMLSDKIKVSGKLNLAIYWFNLIAPKSGV